MKTPITIIGNLGGDPELRVTAAGDSVAAFSVAVTDRVKDKRSGEWADGETTWYRRERRRMSKPGPAGNRRRLGKSRNLDR